MLLFSATSGWPCDHTFAKVLVKKGEFVSCFQETGQSEKTGSDHQQALDTSVFGLVNHYAAAQVAFLFFRFCTCDVAQSCPVALHFTCTSNRESLLGAGVGLHFRHDKTIVI